MSYSLNKGVYLAHTTTIWTQQLISNHAATLWRTGDVPQLQPHHRLLIPVEHFEGEVHSDGGAVVLGEDLVHVALYDGRLTDPEVADDQNFEQALVLHHHHCWERALSGRHGEVSNYGFRMRKGCETRRVWPVRVGLESCMEADSWNTDLCSTLKEEISSLENF